MSMALSLPFIYVSISRMDIVCSACYGYDKMIGTLYEMVVLWTDNGRVTDAKFERIRQVLQILS